MHRAISVACASSSALSRNSGWMRSPGGVRRHAGSAAFAARTAVSTSAAGDSGTPARLSPVAGLFTGSWSFAVEACHRPPM
jgi:hypothetical protein